MARPIHTSLVATVALCILALYQVAQATEYHAAGNASGTFVTANFESIKPMRAPQPPKSPFEAI
jgi:hypothetical protein